MRRFFHLLLVCVLGLTVFSVGNPFFSKAEAKGKPVIWIPIDDFFIVRGGGGTLLRYVDNDIITHGHPEAAVRVLPVNGQYLYGWYHPNPGFSGVDSFQYDLCLFVCSPLATVTVMVIADDAHNAGGCDPPPPPKPSTPPDSVGGPVNVTNGNMWLEQTDYSLPGIGENIAINRFYNSVIQQSGLFGLGWSTKYDESLWFYDNAPFGFRMIRLNMPNGRAIYFGRANTTDPFVSFTADVHGQIVKNADDTYTLTFKDGRIHKFSSTGKLLWQKDRNGNQTSLTYDINNTLATVTDAFNRTLTFTPNPDGTISQISDSTGTIATYEYWPGTTRLKTVTYPDDSKYKFDYTTINNKTYLTTVKDALDNILEAHQYDFNGRATTSEKHSGVEKYTLAYINTNDTTVTDILGRVTKYYFDKSRGRNVITKTEGTCGGCGGGGSEVTQYFYDPYLNIVKTIDALSNQTLYTYDSNANLLTAADVFGTQKWTYNSVGQVLTYKDRIDSQSQDPNVNTLVNSYDPSGNLLTTKDALNNITTIGYPLTNNKGLPDWIKDARFNTTKFKWFPTTGLLQEIEDPYGKKTSLTYDMGWSNLG